MAGAVLCFGEALWDSLPAGLFPGGAPLNVAYHLARCGANALPVTAVGDDVLGGELLGRIERWGCDLRCIAVVPGRATGLARAHLARNGAAAYSFNDAAAWDFIPVPPAALAAAAPAVIHGTLALRGEHNRGTLAALLAAAPDACRVCDVNLRPPHDKPGVVRRIARGAGLLKVNADELRLLTDGDAPVPPAQADLERRARALAVSLDCVRVCVTAGAAGAGLLWDGAWYWERAAGVQVRDTVGAGDAFLARLVQRLLIDGASPERGLADACRLGEFVAGRDGATPAYSLLTDGTIVPS